MNARLRELQTKLYCRYIEHHTNDSRSLDCIVNQIILQERKGNAKFRGISGADHMADFKLVIPYMDNHDDDINTIIKVCHMLYKDPTVYGLTDTDISYLWLNNITMPISYYDSYDFYDTGHGKLLKPDAQLKLLDIIYNESR